MGILIWDLGPRFSTHDWPHPPRTDGEKVPTDGVERVPDAAPMRQNLGDYKGTVTKNGQPEMG